MPRFNLQQDARLPLQRSLLLNRVLLGIVALYFLATLQFVRFYSQSTIFYLRMSDYLSGHERLPFQERILPIVVLRPMFHSKWIMGHFAHENGAFTTSRGPFYLLSLVSLVVAGCYTQKLYWLVSQKKTLPFLVYPLFLFVTMWTYCIHNEANFSYPYDLPGLAFFAAGLCYLYQRSYTGLLIVVFVGTFNRETTLFLIILYVIDAATRVSPDGASMFRGRFDLRLVRWVRVLLLVVVWVAVKGSLAHAFRSNDTSESFLRLSYNLARLKPRLLPALLNICGYSIPLILLLQRRIRPERFRNYLFVLPAWFVVMCISGVLLETRIYGELCPYAAVCLVIIMEESVTHRQRTFAEVAETSPEHLVSA